MPNDSKLPSNRATEEFVKFLEQKWGTHPCPLCGARQWQIQPSAFELRQYHGRGIFASGAVTPVVPVVCGNCGNTVLVNAIVAGVVPRPEEPADEG